MYLITNITSRIGYEFVDWYKLHMFMDGNALWIGA